MGSLGGALVHGHPLIAAPQALAVGAAEHEPLIRVINATLASHRRCRKPNSYLCTGNLLASDWVFIGRCRETIQHSVIG
jgi:hypothetical protein